MNGGEWRREGEGGKRRRGKGRGRGGKWRGSGRGGREREGDELMVSCEMYGKQCTG